MGRQNFNETFSLEIPDTFEPLGEEDFRRLAANGGGPYQWGARDPENHRLIIAMWKQYPALLSMLADMKSMAKKNAQMTAKAYEGHGYRFLGFFTPGAGEAKAEGYRYAYGPDGAVQVVDTFLVRSGKIIYAFLCSGREANAEADHALFCRVLESLEWI